MKEEEDVQEPGQRAERKAEDVGRRQDLASPCVILPSATLSTFAIARHQKTGSIGESVFLGAGAIKKRKLDEVTQANKENIGPDGEKPLKVTRPRKSAKTPTTTASASMQNMPRPQSTGGLRNGKRSSKSVQRDLLVTNGVAHSGTLGMSEIVSPVNHPLANRPWSAAGTRTLPDTGTAWIADTPTNQRQYRLQQTRSGAIARPGSTNSAIMAPQTVPSIFGGHPLQPDLAGRNSHYQNGMTTPGLSVMGGMELYVTDINGHSRLLPPNTIPVQSGPRQGLPMPHGVNPMSGGQYIPYGVQHGMSPFSAVQQEGSFMLYDRPPPFIRTNSRNSVTSVDGHQSHRPPVAQHFSHQAYTYPTPQFPQLPLQYKHTEPSGSAGTPMHGMTQPFDPETDQLMPYANGLARIDDQNAPGGAHALGCSKDSSGMRRTGTESSSATGSRSATSHAGSLDMPLSMPLSTSANANLTTAAGFETGLTGLDDPEAEESRSAGATSSRASHRGKGAEMTLVGTDADHERIAQGMIGHALTTTTTTAAQGNDGQRTPAAPIVLEPTNHTREMSEMEAVEREFVKFSDGSDRDAFWTNDAM